MTRIRVRVGERTLGATLDGVPTARDFADLLPLELTLRDFRGIEKVSDLPRRLTTEGAPASAAASAGDIALYAPRGNLAIFYADFPPAAGLVRLGRFDDGIEPLLEEREFRVRIEVASEPPTSAR